MTSAALRGIFKSFGSGRGETTQVLTDVSFAAEHGEFLVLLGPSGCGKSTSLRLIAGLEHADQGDVLIGGERRSEEHTSELQSRGHLVCRLLLEIKKLTMSLVNL